MPVGGPEKWGYAEAVAALEHTLQFGINPSLDAIRAMCSDLGDPQSEFAAIQVGGTNGKSSTTRLVAAILEAHGVKAGAYVSPDLHSYTERIECGGEPVSEELFAGAIHQALQAAEHTEVTPTEFEVVTAAALAALRECGVDVAVLEVGLGGRWDATSVVTPAVAAITGVALDHTDRLGDTREEIATDKAHIIKEGSVAILGPGTIGVERIFEQHARAVGAAEILAVRPGTQVSPFDERQTIRFVVTANVSSPDGVTRLDVSGYGGNYGGIEVHGPAYQAANVATALAAAEVYLGRALDVDALRAAVAAVRFPGRFQTISRNPWLVVDGAHNQNAAEVLAKTIQFAWPDAEVRPTIILGVLADKDAAGMTFALAPLAGRFVCTAPDSSRALSAEKLAAIVERVTGEAPLVANNVADAIGSVRDAGEDAVVTGSIRTVADALAFAAD